MNTTEGAESGINPAWLKLPKSAKTAKKLKLKTYFTGVPCKWGHIAPRHTHKHRCSVCTREAQKIRQPQRNALRRQQRAEKYLNKWAQLPDNAVEAKRLKLPYFFNPKFVCEENGHTAPQRTSNSACKGCDDKRRYDTSKKNRSSRKNGKISSPWLPKGCKPIGIRNLLSLDDNLRNHNCQFYMWCGNWSVLSPHTGLSWVCSNRCKYIGTMNGYHGVAHTALPFPAMPRALYYNNTQAFSGKNDIWRKVK